MGPFFFIHFNDWTLIEGHFYYKIMVWCILLSQLAIHGANLKKGEAQPLKNKKNKKIKKNKKSKVSTTIIICNNGNNYSTIVFPSEEGEISTTNY
jgi:hypothetical protein